MTVAVIDSGICASHPDLAGRIVDGWDFLESDAVPQDDFGHGCSIAGVIAANMNDGIGIAGVALNAQIMPLRVLNASGVGSYSDVAAAIVYAADNGAQVINLSLFCLEYMTMPTATGSIREPGRAAERPTTRCTTRQPWETLRSWSFMAPGSP